MYLNLPELLAQRIVCQINSNGDERIDHDEFIQFFLELFMGSQKQKMIIAFKCFDFDDEDRLTQENVLLLLKHIPQNIEGTRYGISFTDDQ